MEIYKLSRLGAMAAHSIRPKPTPEWGVIIYLNRNHSASKEKLLAEVPGATSGMLGSMRRKHLLIEETGVGV